MTTLVFRPRHHDVRIGPADPDWARLSDIVGPERVLLARLRLSALCLLWKTYFGVADHDFRRIADLEDWVENAVLLQAALTAGLRVRSIGFEDADIDTLTTDEPMVFLGAQKRHDPIFRRLDEKGAPLVWPVGGRPGRAQAYWNSPTLVRALRRETFLASGRSEGEDGFVAGVRSLVARGIERLVVKVVGLGKYAPVSRLELARDAHGRIDTSTASICRVFYDTFDANMYDLCDRDACFLIQEERPLRHEYRVVVVDGKPVAGAGCVESLSPIFHFGEFGPFDALVEGKRGDGALSLHTHLVFRYRDFASSLTADLIRSGQEDFCDCVLDLAYDADREEIVLVEVNPADNFGMYALDWSAVFAAILMRVTKNAHLAAAAERRKIPCRHSRLLRSRNRRGYFAETTRLDMSP